MNNKTVLKIEFFSNNPVIHVATMRPSDLLAIAYANYGKEETDTNKVMADYIKTFTSKVEIIRDPQNKFQYKCIPH